MSSASGQVQILPKLGHVGGLHQPYRMEDVMTLELGAIKSAVDLAMQVGIASDPKHLVVRDLLPDKDFRDISGNVISGRAWRQPWSGTWGNTPYTLEQDNVVYRINRNTEYHNKIYVFYGTRYVNRGLAEPQPVTHCDSVTWKDSANTYDIWDTQSTDVHREVYAFQPILVKNYVEYTVQFRPRSDASGAFDAFQLLGKIVEKRGETIAGNPGT